MSYAQQWRNMFLLGNLFVALDFIMATILYWLPLSNFLGVFPHFKTTDPATFLLAIMPFLLLGQAFLLWSLLARYTDVAVPAKKGSISLSILPEKIGDNWHYFERTLDQYKGGPCVYRRLTPAGFFYIGSTMYLYTRYAKPELDQITGFEEYTTEEEIRARERELVLLYMAAGVPLANRVIPKGAA